MRIIVDADATPSINLIEKLASNDQVPCILIADDTHDLTSTYSEVITVSKGFQSVDMYLVNIIKEHDIVITQDYGLATIALSKNCYVIHPKGTIYTNDNIDIMLATRHLNAKKMQQKKHLKGPKKRNKDDDERVIQ